MEEHIRELLKNSYKGEEIIQYIENLEKTISDMHDQAEIDVLHWIINQKDNEIYRLNMQIDMMFSKDEEDELEIIPVIDDKSESEEDYNCFLCDKHIEENEHCYFSLEFDSYICKKCHDELRQKDYDTLNDEEKIIKNEFF